MCTTFNRQKQPKHLRWCATVKTCRQNTLPRNSDQQTGGSQDCGIFTSTGYTKEAWPVLETGPGAKQMEHSSVQCSQFSQCSVYVFPNSCAAWKHFSPQRLRQQNRTHFSWKYIDRSNANQEFCNGWRRRRNHLLIKWQFLKTNEENCQDTLSEDQETTYNTKQRLRQECSRHNKLNKEGWDAEEWRGNMKPWNIAGSEEMNTHTHRLKCRTGSPRDKNWSLNGEAPSWKFSSPESIVSL